MAIEARNQEFGLRLAETRGLPFSFHELGSLGQIPRSLCLIKNRDMFYRWPNSVGKAIISKMMNVLNERLHLAHRVRFPNSSPLKSFSAHFVPCKCFSKNCHKRAIARKKD